jgi:hypothetical protein
MINYSLVLSIFYSGKAWVLNGDTYEGLDWFDSDLKPTKEELDSKYIEAINISKKDKCENQAKTLIANCDWSVLPDVNITNKSEFENYRSILRNLILNPIEDPIFPIEPTPIWSK